MLFKKDNSVPAQIKAVKLESWYSELDDQTKIKLSRYLEESDTCSKFDFFVSMIRKALADDNPKFAVILCEQTYEECELTDYQMFIVNEDLIDAYIGASRYDDAKAACLTNLELYSKVKEDVLSANNGKLPEKLNFRNRYIDIIVGIDSSYDLAFETLEKYNEMGLIDDEELKYRVNSLKTHRLQRVFDGIYSYKPKDN